MVLEGEPAEGARSSSEQTMQQAFSSTGWETIVFTMEPNPGEGFRDLSRIASGGESSRLMLALKVTGQTDSKSQCLTWMEFDAGVGGRVAYQIGERLKKVVPQSAGFMRD